MQLKYAKNHLIHLPNAEEVVAKVQAEYDILVERMAEYYKTKKAFVAMKKQSIQATYENLELDFKYKEMKQSFSLQKEKWQSLYDYYLEPANA